jgi:iron-sulfur cluster assembly accessory protein
MVSRQFVKTSTSDVHKILSAAGGKSMADITTDQIVETTQVVSLTPLAIEKVRELLENEGDPELSLRVFVAGGGCSGLQYQMALTPSEEDDMIFEYDGVHVLVDPISAQYIAGSEIDYKESLMGAGFVVNNPNAVSSCGCGSSFRTGEDNGQARACGCGH